MTNGAEKMAINEREAANAIGISARTLWELRARGDAPPHARLGKRVVYPVASLETWLAERATAAPMEASR